MGTSLTKFWDRSQIEIVVSNNKFDPRVVNRIQEGVLKIISQANSEI